MHRTAKHKAIPMAARHATHSSPLQLTDRGRAVVTGALLAASVGLLVGATSLLPAVLPPTGVGATYLLGVTR